MRTFCSQTNYITGWHDTCAHSGCSKVTQQRRKQCFNQITFGRMFYHARIMFISTWEEKSHKLLIFSYDKDCYTTNKNKYKIMSPNCKSALLMFVKWNIRIIYVCCTLDRFKQFAWCRFLCWAKTQRLHDRDAVCPKVSLLNSMGITTWELMYLIVFVN